MAASEQNAGIPQSGAWPALPFEAWQDTATTLHMWTQIVGKIRLALSAAGEPLVARRAVRHGAGADHLADAVRRPRRSRSTSTSSTTSCASRPTTARCGRFRSPPGR